MNNTPKITLITCGYKEIRQTHANIEHIISEGVEPYVAFNDGLKSSNSLIYGFLDENVDFACDDVVEKIVKRFLEYPEIGGIYTDNTLNGKRQYYPAYSYQATLHNRINTPFFCRRELKLEFVQSDTYYDAAIKKMGSYTILHHIPEALFTITSSTSSTSNTSKTDKTSDSSN